MRASLVGQWLRIHLATQGQQFNPWSRRIPLATEQQSLKDKTAEPVVSLGVATTEAPVV